MTEKSRAFVGFSARRVCVVIVISVSFYNVQAETTPSPQDTTCSSWRRFFCAQAPPTSPKKGLDMDSVISLCASQIIEGNISEAGKTFHMIRNIRAIAIIVKKVYSKDRDVNLIRLVQFATELDPTQQNIVYTEIYWEMVHNGEIDSPNFLVLASQWNGQNGYVRRGNFDYPWQVKYIKRSWANEIRNPNRDPRRRSNLVHLRNYLSLRCETYLEPVWTEIIEKSFDRDLSNIENILAFALGTTLSWQEYNETTRKYQEKSLFNETPICPIHRIAIMEALTRQMMEVGYIGTKQFILVAYYLKAEMERVQTSYRYEGIRLNSLERYTQIKQRFPLKIQNLVWDGRSCFIMSVTYSEYLCAELPEFNKHAQESGSVYTWISNQTRTRMVWNVESKEIESIGKFFTIHNVNIGKNLFSKDDKNGTSKVSYWIPEGRLMEDKWTIQPSNDGGMFLIKNFLDGKYLSAAPDTHDTFRRNVETSTEKHFWKVECQQQGTNPNSEQLGLS